MVTTADPTKTAAPETAATADAKPVEAEAPEAPAAQSVDPRDAKIAKLENDLKAAIGRGKPTEAILARLDAFEQERREEREIENKTRAGLLRAVATNDPEERTRAVAETETAQAEFQKNVLNRKAIEFRTNIGNEIATANMDSDGKPILDWEKAPELEQARRFWSHADQTGDAASRYLALSEMNKALYAHQKALTKEKEDAAEKRGREAQKAETRKAADLNQKGPAAAGGTAESLAQLVAKPTKDMNYGELLAHNKKLDAAMKQGR